MKKALVIGTAVVVLGAAGGFAAVRLLGGTQQDVAAELVPADAFVYANLFISPSNDQKRALDQLLSRFPQIESTDAAIDRLTDLLDQPLSEAGLDYEEDVEPWLGDQASFFLTGEDLESPEVAVLLETTDPDATADAIEKARENEDAEDPEQETYEGVDYTLDGDTDEQTAMGFVDDFLVVGTEEGFKSVVDTSQGADTLTGSTEFEEAFEGLDEDAIFSFYLDQGRLFEAVQESGDLDSSAAAFFNAFPGLEDAGSTALVVAARENGVALQASGAIPEDEAFSGYRALFRGTDIFEQLPADSWLAFGVPGLGETIRGFFEVAEELPGAEGQFAVAEREFKRETGLSLERDVLSWMGDAALFVQGTNLQEIGGALIVESSDEAKTQVTLQALRATLERDLTPTTDEERDGFEGFSIQEGLPAPIYALAADRLIVSYGDRATEDAMAPDETLGNDPTYQEAQKALGDGYTPSLYVDLDGVTELVEFAMSFSGEADPTYEQEVKPWLDPLSFFIAGARQDGDRTYQTIFVGVQEESS